MGGKSRVVEIIRQAPERMQEMLGSVVYYNSSFCVSENTKKLFEKILFAISVIDRGFFAESEYAYYDNALPIEKGQTISQPSTIARMLLLTELEDGNSVLEIGAGSGWNASLIAFLVYPGNVKSIDRINSLVEKAQENANKLRNFLKQKHPQDLIKLNNLNFITENIFSKGKIWKKQYDRVIITAGIQDRETENKIEEIARSLLKKNGLLICPYVSGPILIYKKEKGGLKRKETKEEYVFVPLLEGIEE